SEIGFSDHLSLSVLPNMFQEKEQSEKIYPGMNMYMQITIQKLAKYFSCEPTVEAVVKKRNELAKKFPEYTKNLFEDVQLKGLLLDFGYPQPPISKNKYNEITGVPSWEVYRIEPLMDNLRESSSNFTDFIDKYREELNTQLSKSSVFGLKSIIAYRSGLDIGKMDKDKASIQYKEFQENKRSTVKELRDYCIHVAMEECTKAEE